MEDHRRAIRGVTSLESYASGKHKHQNGKTLNPDRRAVPYRSTILNRRLIVETALIEVCSTVDGNKASKYTTDMDVLAPAILNAANINWREVARLQPNLNPRVVPRKHKSLFRNQNHPPRNNTSSNNDLPDQMSPFLEIVPHNYQLRSRTISRNEGC